jgi:signal transduction histidine kinase
MSPRNANATDAQILVRKEPGLAIEPERAALRISDGGTIAVVAADPPKPRYLRGFKPGAGWRPLLERIDDSLALEIEQAVAERLPTAGTTVVRLQGSWVALDYHLVPGQGGGDNELSLSVSSAAAHPGLSEATRREQASFEALTQVMSHLNRSLSPKDAAHKILPLIVPDVGAVTGALFRAGIDGRADLLSAFGPTRRRGFPYSALDLRDPHLVRAAHGPGLIRMEATSAGRLPQALADVCPRRWRSLLIAPAFAGHDLQALLLVSGDHEVALQRHQSNLLRIAADALGLFLGHVAISQYSQAGQVVLDTAGVVARSISGSLDLNETFHQIAMSATRIIGNCSCLLLELRPESDELVPVAASNPKDNVLLHLALQFAGAAGTRVTLQQNQSIVVEDIVWSARTPVEVRKRLRFRSALFVPIHAEEGLIGALMLHSAQRRDSYSERDIAQAELVAEQAASAICNARLYQDLKASQRRAQDLLDRITQLRQEQRLELANVIHNEIVQTAIAALYETEALRDRVSVESLVDIERVASLMRMTISEARKVVGDLRPPALEGLGLAGSIRALGDRMARETSCNVRVEFSDPPDLRQDVQEALYVIVREALNNARRHANARHVTVRLSLVAVGERPNVRLDVIDDGVGFAKVVDEQHDHFGLKIMDEQATFVGGSVSVQSEPGKGVHIRAILPIVGWTESDHALWGADGEG